ncbi:hypothetical protein BH10PLA1_BH10PLA1_14570 [soil metagenome]
MEIPELEISEGTSRRRVPIGKKPITIGRHEDNQLIISDNRASRYHCVVEMTDKGLLLTDLNSRNGTLVNGAPVKKTLLNTRDVITIGQITIKVLLPEPEVEEAELEEVPDEPAEPVELDPVVHLQKTAASLADNGVNEADINLLNARNLMVHPGRVAQPRKPGAPPDIVDILRNLLLVCFRSRASDIHIEPKNDDYVIRMRIDGNMVELLRLAKEFGLKLTAVVKILCDIDIGQRGSVQEGHFTVKLPDRRVDYRVSFAPAVYGQKLVIRVLDTAGAPQYLWNLGMAKPLFETMQKAIQNESGSIIVCGPTGSGKTTTLYAVVRSMDSGERNIVTIEDPVEIQIDGVTQIPVTAENTFSLLLKSVLRQDPDAMLVGEVRDTETAKTAMQAAITGHLVFTTLHSRDTVGALFRLLDLGVEPYLAASAVQVILAQRLVRKLCQNCKKAVRATGVQQAKMAVIGEVTRVYEPVGCPKCLGTGYLGRQCVFELLNMNEAMRDIVMRSPNLPDIQRALMDMDFVSLQQSGYALVAEGVTSFTEVERAVSV